MAKRGLAARFLPWLFVFGMGVGVGYYARDRQQHERIQEAAETARREMERAGLEAIDRARQAGEDLSAGAQAAAESTKAAFRKLLGESRSR